LLLLSFTLSFPLPAHASKKTLVLFPLVLYADKPSVYLRQGVRSMLASRLSGGGLELISDESLLGEKEGITSKERAEELARRLKADYAIFGSITAIGGGYSLDISILELDKDRSRLTRVSEAASEDQFIPKLSDVAYRLRAIIEGKEKVGQKMEKEAAILPKPETIEEVSTELERDKKGPEVREMGYQIFKPTGKISVKMAVMAFDMGDLDGDRQAELVILGRKRLLVYYRKGESFVPRDSLKASWGEDFLKVSVGDADNNGMAEIYLVSRYGTRARSTVLAWTGGFKRLYRRTGNMQVVRDGDGSRSVLLFQDSKVERFFSGRIYIMDYDKGGELTKRQKLPKLKGVQFYTLTPFDLDRDGDPEFLGLGKHSRLHVWDKEGKVLWSGSKKIGGTNNAIRLGARPDPESPPPRIPFNSRLIIADIDGDGNMEILAIKNIPFIENLGNFKVHNKSNLMAYKVEGTSLYPAWTSRQIDYCLIDMQADGRGLFLAAQKGKIQKITKGSGLIMWFE
ncbi:MAG: VCBS repeat-containing protein, partial [Desulfatiglandales bacterium]